MNQCGTNLLIKYLGCYTKSQTFFKKEIKEKGRIHEYDMAN